MRALVMALAALLAFPALAGAQQRWVQAYDDGVKAYEQGNFALAEIKLVEAKNDSRAPKTQTRKHAFSSIAFRPYIPDYYLGMIAARNKQYAKAKELLESALANNLVTSKERAEYAAAQDAIAEARAALTPKPPPPGGGDRTGGGNTGGTTGGGTTGTPAGGTTGGKTGGDPSDIRIGDRTGDGGNTRVPGGGSGPTPPPPPPTPAWLARFQQAMGAARTALGQQRYSEARASAATARREAGDAARQQEADALRRDIETALTGAGNRLADNARGAIRRKDIEGASTQVVSLETLVPDHASLPELKNAIEQLKGALQGAAALAQVERTGVKLFLSGNYKQSADELQRGINRGVKSPRVYLFLASSVAAQALLAAKDDQPALVAEARRHYQQATSGGNALANEQRFISPSILDLLKGS